MAEGVQGHARSRRNVMMANRIARNGPHDIGGQTRAREAGRSSSPAKGTARKNLKGPRPYRAPAPYARRREKVRKNPPVPGHRPIRPGWDRVAVPGTDRYPGTATSEKIS